MRDSAAEMITRRRRRKKSSPLFYIMFFGCVAIAFFAYFRYQSQSAIEPAHPRIQQQETTSSTNEKNSGNVDLQSSTAPTIRTNQHVPADFSSDSLAQEAESITAEAIRNEKGQFRASEFEDLAAKVKKEKVWADHQRALTNIELFYSNLDNKGYLTSLGLTSPSKEHFSSLIQKLLDNPPIVTGETDDLFNLLHNTAHFFRIVGKQNIILIKAILSKENDSFEEILEDYYTLAHSPEYLSKGFAITLDSEALYDYAGFFLTTMGGRLYLFRRDSVSRMVVSYYSIRIIDEANRNGTNRHGIDIRPAITMLINELENSGAQLKLKEYYLDTLYDIKGRYL